MKVLLTNDDGIDAKGISILAEWAKQMFDEVWVVAPKVEQSGASHGIILRHSFEVKRRHVFDDLGIPSYHVDSTPADCVRYAFDKFGKFDLVLSGINHGFNIGYDISYSATCAGATEGCILGSKSVAISSDLGALDVAGEQLTHIWSFITNANILAYASLLNVNVPHDPQGMVLTEQGGVFYADHFEEVEPDQFHARGYIAHDPKEEHKDKFDTDAVLHHLISISPLSVHRTDLEALKALRGLTR